MSKEVRFRIITPERTIYDENVEMVIARGTEGEIGILFDHTPLVTLIPESVLKIKRNKVFNPIAVSGGGFLEIIPEQITVLADAAELPEEIDLKRAEEAKRRAEERLMQGEEAGVDVKRAMKSLKKAEARIQAVEQQKK